MDLPFRGYKFKDNFIIITPTSYLYFSLNVKEQKVTLMSEFHSFRVDLKITPWKNDP